MKEVVVTTGAKSRAKLQPNRHHQQINTQLFTGWMPCLSPNRVRPLIENDFTTEIKTET